MNVHGAFSFHLAMVIGSLINADLRQRMKMLSLKEEKPAGKLLDNAMEKFLKKREGNRENSHLG